MIRCLSSLVLVLSLTLSPVLSANSLSTSDLESLFAFAQAREAATVGYLQTTYPSNYATQYPTVTNATTGVWGVGAASGWTSGFFPGTLWNLYGKTGDSVWLDRAKAWTAGIEGRKTDTGTHDVGFQIMNSFGNAYRQSNDANDPGGAYRSYVQGVVTTAATSLNTRYNMPRTTGGVAVPVGAIRSWTGIEGQYPVCIDNMMNLELLFFAYDVNGKQAGQKVWYDNAVQHARTTMTQLVRADGSTYHVVRHYDGSATIPVGKVLGDIERKNTRQGFGDETTWSRGQAWAIYGFTKVYEYTRDDPSVSPIDFLNTAKSTADYFISHLPANYAADPFNFASGDFVPPTDFNAALGEPAGPWCDADNDGKPNEANSGTGYVNDTKTGTGVFTGRDTSAAAIAASALMELSTFMTDPGEKQKYFSAGESILYGLATYKGSDTSLDYLAADSVHRGILANASQYYGGVQQSINYADYYFVEGLSRYEALTAVPLPESASLAGIGAILMGCWRGAGRNRKPVGRAL